MPRLTGWRPRRRDRGAVAVLVSMMITSGMVFGLGALTVDVGLIYAERAQLQTAADAAAIAVAKVCALRLPECNEDDMLLEGGRYARRNVKNAAVQVTEVCGEVDVPSSARKPIEACTRDETNLTRCLGSRSGDGAYVEVRVRTDRDGESSALPPVFAGAVTGTDGVTVGACARASWRGIGTVKDALPVVVSKCVADRVIDDHDLQPEPSGGSHHAESLAEITLPFRETGGDFSEFCRNPGWDRLPGERSSDATDGFSGEVSDAGAEPCDTSFTSGTVRALTGAAGGNEEEFWEDCFPRLVDLHRRMTPVPVAVYRLDEDSDGAYIDSVRGFVVTGWRKSGWPLKEAGDALPDDRWSQQPLNADADCPTGAESCLFGYFTTDPDGGGVAGPTSIRITG